MNVQNTRGSKIVPQKLFYDLFRKNERGKIAVDGNGKMMFNDPNGLNILKDRISKQFGVDKSTLLSYDELLKTPKGEKTNIMLLFFLKVREMFLHKEKILKQHFYCFTKD